MQEKLEKFCFILFKALDLELSLHADFIGLKKMSNMELVLTFSHRRQFAVFKSAFSKPTSKVLFERNQNTSVVHYFVKILAKKAKKKLKGKNQPHGIYVPISTARGLPSFIP